jgi:hypothetical protein
MSERAGMEIKNKFISAAIVAGLSFVVSLSVTMYSERSPKLTYELFSSDSFDLNNKKRSVSSFRIENNGRKEAESVEVAFKYKEGMTVMDKSIILSSEAIVYKVAENTEAGMKLHLPILNPTESITISFVGSGDKGFIDVGLRAKGEVGKKKDIRNIQRKEVKFLVLYGLVIIFLTAGFIFLVLYFISPVEKKDISNALKKDAA